MSKSILLQPVDSESSCSNIQMLRRRGLSDRLKARNDEELCYQPRSGS